jgi:hypothetical protein
VRDVGEQRAERDDELDAEVAGDGNDLVREGAPAEVRLEPEHEHGVPLRLGDGRVVEGGLRPDDLASDPALESYVRAGRLEVEELLRIDVGETPCLPRLREEAGGERGALSAVVPTSESGDEDGPAQRRAALDADVRPDTRILGKWEPARPEHEAAGDADDPRPHKCGEADVEEDESPGEPVSPLDLPDRHLGQEEGQDTARKS